MWLRNDRLVQDEFAEQMPSDAPTDPNRYPYKHRPTVKYLHFSGLHLLVVLLRDANPGCIPRNVFLAFQTNGGNAFWTAWFTYTVFTFCSAPVAKNTRRDRSSVYVTYTYAYQLWIEWCVILFSASTIFPKIFRVNLLTLYRAQQNVKGR